jgi:mono/diheme cytochrome c family protein
MGGCAWPGQPNPKDRPVPANKVDNFDLLYRENCAGCHGADGKMGPAPPLNDPLFLSIVPDEDLLCVVSAGRDVSAEQKTPMPGFAPDQAGPLTFSQIKILAEGLKERWKKNEQRQDDPPPYNRPVADGPGDAKRGATVFATACAECHGRNGEGVLKDGQRIGILHDRVFLSLISDQALRRIIITGRPDLGMPDYTKTVGSGPAASRKINDIVALLASWRKEEAVREK